MGPAEADLAAEVEGWLARAEGADAEEDAALGADRRGDEMPAWMRDKRRRLERIRVAKAELEAEPRAAEAARPDRMSLAAVASRPTPEVGAECVSSACSDLSGGRGVTRVPTGTHGETGGWKRM